MGNVMATLLDSLVGTFRQNLRRQTPARFVTRDPMRDERTDTERLERLRSAIEQIVSEIEAERQGLKHRYGRQCQDAGLLMSTMENDGRVNAPSQRLDGLTRSILHCEGRLARMSLQVKLVNQLQQLLEQNVSVQWFGDGLQKDCSK